MAAGNPQTPVKITRKNRPSSVRQPAVTNDQARESVRSLKPKKAMQKQTHLKSKKAVSGNRK